MMEMGEILWKFLESAHPIVRVYYTTSYFLKKKLLDNRKVVVQYSCISNWLKKLSIGGLGEHLRWAGQLWNFLGNFMCRIL